MNYISNQLFNKMILHIVPTLTDDRFVTSGILDLNGGTPADEY